MPDTPEVSSCESAAGVQHVRRIDPGHNPQPRDAVEALAVLARSWRLLAVFVVSAMGSALALTYFNSERYRAATMILYRPNSEVRFEGISPQQRTMGFPVPLTAPFEALGLSIQQVGTSERILRPVVVELGLDQPDATPRAGFASYYHETKEALRKCFSKVWEVLKYGRTIEANPTTTAIRELAANTTIDTKQKSYAATLTVADKDPTRAALIADHIGAELVKFMQELSTGAAREQGGELDGRLAEKRTEIDRVRSTIESLKTTQEFIDLSEETALRLRTAEQFEQKLLTTTADLSAARAKLKVMVNEREAIAPWVKASELLADDSVYNHLRDLRASLEVELQGLLERSPRDDPDSRSVQAKIRTTEELLAGARPTRISQVSTELNKVHQTLQAEETRVRADIAGLEAAQAALVTGLDKSRARVTKPAVEAQYNRLQLQLTVLESDYKKLATLREEIRASELTSKAEVRLLHAATPPDEPFRPIKIYHVILAGLLALILGVAFIYLCDYGRSLRGAVPSGGNA